MLTIYLANAYYASTTENVDFDVPLQMLRGCLCGRSGLVVWWLGIGTARRSLNRAILGIHGATTAPLPAAATLLIPVNFGVLKCPYVGATSVSQLFKSSHRSGLTGEGGLPHAWS